MTSKRISNIVFTKNRPLQLHGYLESLQRFGSPQAIQTYIIYKPDLFDAEYELCFRSFPDCVVVREASFHLDFLRLIEQIQTEYILFGIDDFAYFDNIGFDFIDSAFAKIGQELFGFSLRLDSQQMPEDFAAGSVRPVEVQGQTLYALDWTKGQTPSTRYPFELCATVYRTQDLRRLFSRVVSHHWIANRYFRPGSKAARVYGYFFNLRNLYKRLGFFYNPNTLESWCCRYVQRHPDAFGHLLAYRSICGTAIQVNMVNTTTVNEWDDSAKLTVEVLAEKYRQGWRLDLDSLAADKPGRTHSGPERFKLCKKEK
ncbi:hypothetical protein ACQ9LF_12615 [Anaerohalosphaeraceae bacterium U12dextr]